MKKYQWHYTDSGGATGTFDGFCSAAEFFLARNQDGAAEYAMVVSPDDQRYEFWNTRGEEE